MSGLMVLAGGIGLGKRILAVVAGGAVVVVVAVLAVREVGACSALAIGETTTGRTGAALGDAEVGTAEEAVEPLGVGEDRIEAELVSGSGCVVATTGAGSGVLPAVVEPPTVDVGAVGC